jgi:hypothetical protein
VPWKGSLREYTGFRKSKDRIKGTGWDKDMTVREGKESLVKATIVVRCQVVWV